MVFCIAEAVVAVIWLVIAVKKKQTGSRRRAPVILLVIAAMGIVIAIRARSETVLDAGNRIERKSPGQGDRTEALEVTLPEIGEEPYQAVIAERQLTAEEKEEVFQNAKEEAEQIFVGDNDSTDEIRENVVLPATLANGLVQAEWSFDNYEVMQPDGTIIEDAVPESGIYVQAKLEMTCQDSILVYSFYFKVLPQKLTQTEYIKKQLDAAVADANEKTASQNYIALPEQVEGYAIKWQEKKSRDAVNFALLGIIAAAAVVMKEREDQKKNMSAEKNCCLPVIPR